MMGTVMGIAMFGESVEVASYVLPPLAVHHTANPGFGTMFRMTAGQ